MTFTPKPAGNGNPTATVVLTDPITDTDRLDAWQRWQDNAGFFWRGKRYDSIREGIDAGIIEERVKAHADNP